MAENALGRGLDSLIKKPKKSKSNKKQEKKIEEVETPKINNNFALSNDKIEEIKEEVSKNPRISLWSSKSAACLKYLKKTTPEFSISNESSTLLEEAIKNKYPEIWKLFEDL